MNKGKVLVAMSGGIDSSTAAYLLQQDGWEVIGVTMKLFHGVGQTPGGGETGKTCCQLDDFQDAAKVAAGLGIRHYMVNYSDEFEQRVVAPFVQTYIKGMTPSPCILCNAFVKFGKLLHFAHSIGIDHLATGHYALSQYDDVTTRHLLFKGADRAKDQSYFLFALSQEEMRHVLFPLGHMTKAEVRQVAARIGLPVAEKAESQEICFVPDGDYAGFIQKYLDSGLSGHKPCCGEIVRTDGTLLGTHQGIHRYTVGQRRGLGIATGEPLYVVGIDPSCGRVIVGKKEEVRSRRFFVTRCNWIAVPGLDESLDVEVKIRSRHAQAAATLRPMGGTCAEVVFEEPQEAITPGQAAVFYWDNVVVGGGWIYHVDCSSE